MSFKASIVKAYKAKFGVDILDDISAELPTSRQKKFMDIFTCSSRSVMGDPKNQASVDPHDHPAEARHVREFVDRVQQFRGGTWEAMPR